MDAPFTQTPQRATADDSVLINAVVSMADSRPAPAGLLWRKGFPLLYTLPSSGLRYGLSNIRGAGSSADVHNAPSPTQIAQPSDLDTAHGVVSVIPAQPCSSAALCSWLSRVEEA